MIKAKRDELLAPLAAVSGIIERRHTLPILSNVLIDGSAETLSFLATEPCPRTPKSACSPRTSA